MQNQVIPNGSKVDTEYGVFEVINCDTVKDKYFCYKHNFGGHSGASHFGDKYINTKYEGQCWWFRGDQISLVKENKDYRRMKPNDLIDIVLDGNEFKVPLGDLVHAKGLVGGAGGHFGGRFWDALRGVFDKDGCIDFMYEVNDDTASFQKQAFKTYFIDVEKEQQKKELEAEIVAKSNELLELQSKLKELS